MIGIYSALQAIIWVHTKTGRVDEKRSHFLVAMDREGLGVEIGKQFGGWAVGHVELIDAGSASEPGEAHVHRLGSFGFDSTVGQADDASIITQNGIGWLGKTDVTNARAVKKG
jgi:hypothetical protein